MKSKLLKWLALACCGLLSIGLAACGEKEEGGGETPADLNDGKKLNYVLLDDGTYGVTVGECYTLPEITIPAKYEGKTVSTVLSSFFVDAIDEEGNEITIKEKDVVTYSVILSEGITTLQPGAFKGNSLKRLDLAASVVNFGTADETWVERPTSLIEICNKGNLPLTTQETQGEYAWLGRSAENVYTPTSGERKMTMDENGIVTFVDSEGKRALVEYCGTNTVLDVPAEVEYIYENACYSLETITVINVPGTCKAIEDYAFNYCVNVEVVNIANGVESIGYSFMYIDNFMYATIPPSVTALDSSAFNANVYKGVVCYAKGQSDYAAKQHSRNTLYDVVDGVHKTSDGYAYAVKESEVILLKYFGEESEITIANTYDEKPVTMVYNLAFYDNDSLEKLVVGENVTQICESAFQNCDNLFEAVLSDSVETVGKLAFANCENLTKLTVGASVSNTYITYPAFSECYRLIEVYNRSTHENALDGITRTGAIVLENLYTEEGGSKITVEDGFVLYTDGDVCKVVNYIGKATEIVIPDKVTEIGKNAFYSKAVTKVTIGNGVTKIGEKAFSFCTDLIEMTVGTGVAYIADRAFYGENLKEIKYAGTQAQWTAIEKESWGGWYHSNLEKVVCSDGEIPY